MIKIYDINNNVLMQAEVTSAAKREQEMSKSDYISLSFSAAEKVCQLVHISIIHIRLIKLERLLGSSFSWNRMSLLNQMNALGSTLLNSSIRR